MPIALSPPPPRLSVVVVTLNEEASLGRCLASVADVAGEIVVLDSGSADGTEAIARAHGARFEVQPWAGHRAQKQRAVELSTAPWVLLLDADEWLDDIAAAAVAAVLATPDSPEPASSAAPVPEGSARSASARPVAYTLQRWTHFLGAPVRAFGRDRPARLFRRERAHIGGRDPHDVVVVDGPVAPLPGRLLHEPYRTLREYRVRSRWYAALAADAAWRDGARFRWSRLLGSPVGAVLRALLLRGGLLDGRRGLHIALGSAGVRVRRELRLRALQSGRSPPVPAGDHALRVAPSPSS